VRTTRRACSGGQPPLEILLNVVFRMMPLDLLSVSANCFAYKPLVARLHRHLWLRRAVSQSLTSRTKSAVAWMPAAKSRVRSPCSLSVALARLLTPQDYGLIAMATFVVASSGSSARTGMAEALVQRPDVSVQAWSSVYWLGVAIGCC